MWETVLGKKKGRYIPVSKRQDRPDAIAWLLKYYPELSEFKFVVYWVRQSL